LHPTPECLDLAVRRKAFGRALRLEAFLDVAALREYIEAHEQSIVTATRLHPGAGSSAGS